jgi:hypothetical protein
MNIFSHPTSRDSRISIFSRCCREADAVCRCAIPASTRNEIVLLRLDNDEFDTFSGIDLAGGDRWTASVVHRPDSVLFRAAPEIPGVPVPVLWTHCDLSLLLGHRGLICLLGMPDLPDDQIEHVNQVPEHRQYRKNAPDRGNAEKRSAHGRPLAPGLAGCRRIWVRMFHRPAHFSAPCDLSPQSDSGKTVVPS